MESNTEFKPLSARFPYEKFEPLHLIPICKESADAKECILETEGDSVYEKFAIYYKNSIASSQKTARETLTEELNQRMYNIWEKKS